MEWRQLIGKTLHGSICLWLVMNRSSVFSAQKSAYFSVSVLCLGKINENPQSNGAWEDRWEWFKSSPECRNFDTIDGEPMEFEWKLFPGFSTLQLSHKVQDLLLRLGETPENFTGRIFFMSMCNDISWGSKDNKKKFESNAQLVPLFAKKKKNNGAGQWSFLGLVSEKKWHSISEDSPQGEWDKMAEKMMITLAESGHPAFRAASPLSRGQFKSKGGGKLLIHYCADQETITTVFRTITAVNQLSLYGAIAEMCEDFESYHAGRPRHGRTVECFKRTMMILHVKNHYCRDLASFVRMQDSWLLLRSDSISWRKTLKNSHNSQMQWLVVSTLCQETKMHLNRRVGSEGTPKLGPYWKLQLVPCKENMELRFESCLWTRTILTHGSEFVMA